MVGAGPAGAATALLLARFGVEVRLVEREASFERTFRGEGLMPLGIDALFEMGLGGILQTVPGRTVESWDIWIDGEEVFVVPEPVEQLGERAGTRRSPSSGERGCTTSSATGTAASWERR